ncbi:MAG: serine/threonine protein kinase [Firmicutes bacterium]|nr:serine/threonine protein kinase [Bacillota bacterium]
MKGYKIAAQLSSGENSDVYLAVKNGKAYIMKKIKTGSVIPYEMMMGIHHKNIAHIYEVSEEENTVIMEYVSGTPLSMLKRRVDENTVRKWMIQLCGAVSEMHKNKIIHRDIKPSNIMLAEDEQIKLIDFDIARTHKEYMGKDTSYIGTEGFAPPEQYGFAQTDERSDIYAIGAAAYSILTNGDPVQNLDSYSGSLKPIIKKCMQLDPSDRYKSVEELEKAFEGKGALNKKTLLIAAAALLGAAVCAACVFGALSAKNLIDNGISTAAEVTKDRGITLDMGEYSENSAPIGVSSPYLNEKKVADQGAPYLVMCVKLTDNGIPDDAQSAELEFEIFDEDGNTLKIGETTAEISPGSDAVAEYKIYGNKNMLGKFEISDKQIKTIRLVNVSVN